MVEGPKEPPSSRRGALGSGAKKGGAAAEPAVIVGLGQAALEAFLGWGCRGGGGEGVAAAAADQCGASLCVGSGEKRGWYEGWVGVCERGNTWDMRCAEGGNEGLPGWGGGMH